MKLSVVIPTFNRGAPLGVTVQHLLESDLSELAEVEITVVDDGSSVPVDPGLFNPNVDPRFSLRLLRQKNAGPARARNTGFRATTGDVVLFLDDDILAPPELLRGHVSAHRARPGSVICGRCPWLPPRRPGAVYRMLQELGYDAAQGVREDYVCLPVVASGQISVERRMFDPDRGVYRDDLATPAAEEYELSLQLRRRHIPILLATQISALHDSPTTIAALCRQQYKHGLGCGEVARRCPEALEIEELASIVSSSAPEYLPHLRAMARAGLRALGTSRLGRAMALYLVRSTETLAPQSDYLSPLYRLAIAAHFAGGVRDGLRIYREASR